MEQDTYFQSATFQDVLDDLSCRFIVNIPAEELVSVPRICFQIEQAHWFYEDFIREQNPHRLPSLSLRKFSKCIFEHCPLLWQFSGSHEEEFKDFLRYKQRVPVLGGILLDENWEQCILVKAWKGSTWSFPRGKINKHEPDIDCAIREVQEETGYDVSPLILPDAFIELQIKEQRVKLYIIPGVPTNTPMSPQTRKEISSIGWVKLLDLPGYSKNKQQAQPGIKLYMVTPFLFGLRKWIAQNRHKKGQMTAVEEEDVDGIVNGEAVQSNGTADGLIAMLRGQPSPSEQGPDLLSMLRNGTSMQSPHPTDPYPVQKYPQYTYFDLQDPSTIQHSNALPPSAPMQWQQEPILSTAQDSSLLGLLRGHPQAISPPISQPVPQPAHSIPQPTSPQVPFDTARRNSLLSILKGGQPTPNESKSSPPNILRNPDIATSIVNNATVAPSSVYKPVNPANAHHQQSLLSALKSPQLSSTNPPVVNAQQNALLSALKGPTVQPGPTQTSAHQSALHSALKSPEVKTTTPIVETSHQNALLSALTSPTVKATSPPVAPLSSKHQNALLSALSPIVKTTSPPTGSAHQNALLTALKSPPVERVAPHVGSTHQNALLAALQSPTMEICTPIVESQNTVVSTLNSSSIKSTSPPASVVHQSALLATLKSPTMARETPAVSAHQNALLSALQSPMIQEETPLASKQEIKTTSPSAPVAHQNALLSALKGPTIQQGVSAPSHQASLLTALKSPPLPKSTPAHQSSLLSALQSPTTQQSQPIVYQSLPYSPKTQSPPPSTSQTSLLSALKGPSLSSPSMSHQLQLLHTLKSPQLENKDSSSLLSASTDGVVQTSVIPVLSGKDLVASGGTSTVSIVEENIPAELVNGKPLNNVEKGSVASLLSVLKGTKESKTDEIRGDMTSVQTVSGDHANALLSVLKGKSRVETRPSPVENPLLVASSSRMKQVSSSQVSPKRSQNTFSKKNTRQRSPPTNNSSQSLINKDSNGPILPSNSPSITTAHQNSLLSLFNAPKSSSESSTSPSPQFNLHKESQVGKRRQFHDTLVPSGVKTRSSPLKSNDIDLGKMTLLKRASSNDERGTTDPMGVEFVFRKRTLSKGDISPLDIQLTTDPVDTQESPPAMEDEEQVVDEREINQEDCLGTEREMKLVAMLERALARGA